MLNFVTVLSTATSVEIMHDTIQPYLLIISPLGRFTIANDDEHGYSISLQVEGATTQP